MSFRMHAVLGVALISVAVSVLTACGSNSTTSDTAPPAATPPASSASAPASIATTPASEPAGVSTGEGSFVMPNEVGQVLQDAQDDIQRVSRDPMFWTDSTDLTGAGRMQVLDRNWQVCTQNVPPGTTVGSDVKINFGVVKLDENCP